MCIIIICSIRLHSCLSTYHFNHTQITSHIKHFIILSTFCFMSAPNFNCLPLTLPHDPRPRYRPVPWLSYARDYNGRWQLPWDHIWQLALAARTWLLYGEEKKSSKLLYNTDKLFNSILQKYVGYESLACEHAWISCLFFVLDQPIVMLYIFQAQWNFMAFALQSERDVWAACEL